MTTLFFLQIFPLTFCQHYWICGNTYLDEVTVAAPAQRLGKSLADCLRQGLVPLRVVRVGGLAVRLEHHLTEGACVCVLGLQVGTTLASDRTVAVLNDHIVRLFVKYGLASLGEYFL